MITIIFLDPTLLYNVCQFRILCEIRSKISYVKDFLEEKVIDHSLDNVFYGFISLWQMDIMKVSKCFSLDSTLEISSRSNEVLYSLVVGHPDTGKGVPIGYLLTNDQSVAPVLEWLKFLQRQLLYAA
ncbi:hypothetical protein RO3G_09521 [Rhizopus delemar RA 99-880]|uniref:MULE transposase domain-containing protein n=1 Tax=Rhizopus delemar (strain RA 99-880 / ATCC MYA-4621 / FGSC 9543 / NRRL 43880) TaxID=246409 RepID=I1C8N1_RHIO9|nr:hypothetical protein RO3G_09521 [Rhizopus delemar RA 99-880]|eukprot:EIE84811.1 hypothetical protein RO3G_09521 [Rhizopus delemar RA 99-880]